MYISIKHVHFKVCSTKDSNERSVNFFFVKLFAEATKDKLKYSSNKKGQNHERRLLSVFQGLILFHTTIFLSAFKRGLYCCTPFGAFSVLICSPRKGSQSSLHTLLEEMR